jgi:hypothetical protein
MPCRFSLTKAGRVKADNTNPARQIDKRQQNRSLENAYSKHFQGFSYAAINFLVDWTKHLDSTTLRTVNLFLKFASMGRVPSGV